ncbi:MAG: hypothetical protein IRY87_38140 [Acetobacteraceae bacterium]|nr:hypothetical protein [Acetobacteraceae bacterium]
MTLNEGAKALGLSREVFREVRTKLGWRRAKREDGVYWFAVPLAELEREADGSPYATSLDTGYPNRVARATAELIAARDEAESRATAAAEEAAELRERLARITGEREALRDALRAAEAAAAEAGRQAEAARQQAAEYARLAEEAGKRAEHAEQIRRSFAAMPWWRRLLGAPA